MSNMKSQKEKYPLLKHEETLLSNSASQFNYIYVNNNTVLNFKLYPERLEQIFLTRLFRKFQQKNIFFFSINANFVFL